VKQSFSEKAIADADITFFSNGAKGDKLFATKTDSAGIYNLDGLVIYGTQTIKLTSTDNKGKNLGWIQIDSSFKDITPAKALVKTIDTIFSDTTLAKEMAIRHLKKTSIKDTINLQEVKINGNRNTRLFGDVAGSFGYPEESFTVTPNDYDFANLKHYLLFKSKQAVEKNDTTDPGRSRVVFPFFGKNIQPLIVVNGK
jgi:hypothetical protein